MKNLTLSVDEKLVEEGRRYARAHHTSLNALIRMLLERLVREKSDAWIEECIGKMDAGGGHSEGRTWKRKDLYDA